MAGQAGYLATKYMAIVINLFILYSSCSYLPHFVKKAWYLYFQRKEAVVGQSIVTSQGVPQHLVNSQTVSPHLVMCGQSVPLQQHMMSRHTLGSHLVTSQPVMSSGITVSSGLQQVPCSELFVQNTAVMLKLSGYINFCISVFLSFCQFRVLLHL